MDRATLGSAVEAGYITTYALDLATKEFVAVVEVLDGEAFSTYALRFLGVSRFELKDPMANRWERIEVTEMRIEEFPEASETEEWGVWFNFWEAAELSIRCAAIQVNGDVLT